MSKHSEGGREDKGSDGKDMVECLAHGRGPRLNASLLLLELALQSLHAEPR